jgi:hypothetical protein
MSESIPHVQEIVKRDEIVRNIDQTTEIKNEKKLDEEEEADIKHTEEINKNLGFIDPIVSVQYEEHPKNINEGIVSGLKYLAKSIKKFFYS